MVVLGHQKSGTTAIASLLGERCALAISNDPLYSVDWGAGKIVDDLIRRRVRLNEVANRHRSLFFEAIVKEPDYVFLWDDVVRLYDGAEFVFVVRHPLHTIRSVLNRLGLSGAPEGAELPEMTGPTEHWKRILQGTLPEVQGDDYVERLARRWQLAADAYVNSAKRVHLVRYEDFKRSKTAELDRLADALSLQRRRDVSAALDVQYQPAGDPSVDLARFFGPQQLRTVTSICEEGMRQFGYQELV